MSHIIIEGNLTTDAEGGYGKESGKPWARLNVAVNNRVKSQDGSWTDGPTSFYRVTAFGSLAENAMNSLHKGDSVVAAGTIESSRVWDRSGCVGRLRLEHGQ